MKNLFTGFMYMLALKLFGQSPKVAEYFNEEYDYIVGKF